MRPNGRNDALHAKLDDQIAEHWAQFDSDPPKLSLTHDEIDLWRDQFGSVIPVSILAYRHIPIVES